MRESFIRQQALPVAILTILSLLPFINKAFHLDDPVYLWAAKHILSNPFDFYGFEANWYGWQMPMAEINQNPPLVSYFIAIIALFFGWHEPVLHVAFLIPALGVSLGTYYLAKEFCQQPQIAGFLSIASPGFLISATNIMTDVMMLAFYIWSIIFWVKAINSGKKTFLVVGALLITLAALTKYFGLTAILLLLVYTICKFKQFDRRLFVLLYLLIPVLFLLGYQTLTSILYDQGLLSSAALYSIDKAVEKWELLVDINFTGIAFVGGCTISAFFFTPIIWSRRWLFAGCLLMIILVFTLTYKNSILRLTLVNDHNINWSVLVQLTLCILAG